MIFLIKLIFIKFSKHTVLVNLFYKSTYWKKTLSLLEVIKNKDFLVLDSVVLLKSNNASKVVLNILTQKVLKVFMYL